ncbi:septum formation initiator family protein [Aestuariimicrobium sp. p3-SID1156]|uniref:FtsB family cell division protein n=1 Tax=Aestuariimicrobium sp. p3-SID1156 TaxID=2916038 RepID=UPI00223A9B20|nr:septum formation initiator family protein [Aestuariimicrobium sp. p3-SID1156]MCT1458819.1 septum formation initiator family protein [Aestuariimicrobium sp. p3-SID1156]
MSPQGSSRKPGSGTRSGARRPGDTPRSRAGSRAADRSRSRSSASNTKKQAAEPMASQHPATRERTGTTGRSRRGAHAAPRARRSLGVTWRAVAVLAVLFILLLSYLNSLRVYFSQQQEMAETRAQIESERRQIQELQDEKTRWEDPNYVKAQARSRLGWVVPGEVGYKVIGADGKPLGGGAELDPATTDEKGKHPVTWWERLIGSLKTADNPVPAAPTASQSPTAQKTVRYAPPSKTTPQPTSTR